MKTSNSSGKLFYAVLALAALLALPTARAASVSWVGNTSNLWNTAANWSTSAIPTNGSTLVFGTPGSIGSTGSAGVALSDDITSLTVGGAGTNGIVFGPTSAIYTVTRPGSQTITLGSSAGGIAIKDTSVFLQTFSVPMTSATDQTVQIGNTTGAPLSSLTTGTGAWIGGFRMTKTGTGVLTLGNSNVISGLTINQGAVSISADIQLSATAPASATPGWLVLNGGTLRTSTNTSFTLDSKRGIALGDSTSGSGGTINVFNTGGSGLFTLTYNGIIANNGGTNSLTKTGTKILALGGANTYTGATKINQGQVTLDFTASGAPTSNIISSSSNLVMGDVPNSLANTSAGSPILYVQGSTAATSQTFNGTSIHPGNASIVAGGGASTFDTTLNLGALTHTAGGTVGFSTTTNGNTGKGIINTSTTVTATNGILGGWATTAALGAGIAPLTQTDWATVDGSGNIIAYTGYTIPSGATPTLANSAANNVRISSASTGNVSLSFASNVSDLNTIQSTDATGRTIVVGSGNTLRLGGYGGVWTAAAGAMTFGTSTAAGGTLTAGGAANTAGEIVFNSGAAITVNSVIADNGSGAVNLVKTGASTLTLNTNNSFTGGTFINQGTVTTITAGAFGGAGRDVTVMPGALVNLAANGGLTYANNFILAGGTTLTMGGAGGATITTVGNTVSGTVTLLGDTTVGSSGTNGTISGKITGDYSFSAIGGLILSNTSNDFTGNFGVNGTGGPLGGNPVTIKLGANEVLPNGSGKGNVIISGSGTFSAGANLATLDLNGKTETINGLISVDTAQSVVSSVGVTVGNARVTNSNATASTLTLGDNDQTAAFNGTILNGTGAIAITKIGAGRQTLGGANAYTGATTINGGALRVDFTAVGGSSTNSPSNYISSAALNLGGGTLEVLGRANGGTLTSVAFSGASLTSPIITTTTTGLVVGQAVSGTGIPAGAYITYITGTTVTLNANPTATSGTIAASSTTVSTSQSFANTTLNAGASGVSLNANSGNGTAVNLAAITRNTGSTLAITLPSGTQSSTNGVTTTSGTTSTILTDSGVAYATVGGNDWAATAASGTNLVGLSTVSGYTNSTSTVLSGNADVATGVDTTLAANASITSLRFNQAQARTIATGGNTLTTGGILVTSTVGNNVSTISGGTLQGAAGKDLVVIQNNTANGLAIGSLIADNTTATGLTKSGAGVLTLSGTNSYTGATYVNTGTLLVNGNQISATGALSVSSAAILGGSGTIGGAVTINSGGILAPGNSPGNLTVNNNVTIADGGIMSMELNGATVGTQYDRVTMTGAGSVFALSGTNNLALTLGYTPATNALFFLVDNQGSSAVSGIFEQLNGVTTTLTQGALFTVGAQQFQISYTGDVTGSTFIGGNDLVLQAIPEPATWGLLAFSMTTVMVLRRRRQP